jgi:hypothetical protein
MPRQMTDPSQGVPHRQNFKCLTVTKIGSRAPDGAWHQDWLANWPSVVMRLWLVLSRRAGESEVSASLRYRVVANGGQTRLGVNDQELRPWETMRQSTVGWGREHGSWGIYSAGSRYKATTGEDTADWKALVRTVVNFRVREFSISP